MPISARANRKIHKTVKVWSSVSGDVSSEEGVEKGKDAAGIATAAFV